MCYVYDLLEIQGSESSVTANSNLNQQSSLINLFEDHFIWSSVPRDQ